MTAGHDVMDDLRECTAGIVTADSRADGDEERAAPAVGHIDAPDHLRVLVVGESLVEGVEDRVREFRDPGHLVKMADPGR